MSYDLLNYKKYNIKLLTVIFNKNKTDLNVQLINNVRIINKSRLNIKLKKIKINDITSRHNYLLNALISKLNFDILKINNVVPSPIVINNVKNKYALLIGINYTETSNELYGCINDVMSINDKLISNGFSDITIMTDLTPKKATKQNILYEFETILKKAKSGDSLVLLFSGHGTYTRDNNGDEINNYDQCIVSCDFNIITDDDLKNTITKYLKPDVSLLAIFDSCFSGSVLDLRYSYMDGNNYDTLIINNKEIETISSVIMISGCTDNQTSADALMDNRPNGAMTWSLLETLKKYPICSWRELLINMRILLKASNFTQIPLISTGQFSNIDCNHFF